MIRDILTDTEILHKHSEAINFKKDEVDLIVQDLHDTIPSNALGLAAPQIGMFKRVILTNLSSGCYIFINPIVEYTDNVHAMPSVEGCLSLPGVIRCVERIAHIIVKADKTFHCIPTDDNGWVNTEIGTCVFKGPDACIIQHENDHLNGVLLTDLPATISPSERLEQKQNKRRQKILAQRQEKKIKKMARLTSVRSRDMGKKEAEQTKKRKYKQRKRNKKRVEIQERYRAVQEGLFEEENSNDS